MLKNDPFCPCHFSTDIMSRKPPWNLEDAVHMLDKLVYSNVRTINNL